MTSVITGHKMAPVPVTKKQSSLVAQAARKPSFSKPRSSRTPSLSLSIFSGNQKNDERETLFKAAASGNIDFLRTTLSDDSFDHTKINEVHGDYSENLLITAAKNGHNDAVKLFLQHGIKKDEGSSYWSTALHEAAGVGCEEVVITLLNAGCNPLLKNKYGMTPFLCAAC